MEDTKKISSRVLINPELRTDSLRTANPFRSTVLQIDQGVNGRMVGNPESGQKRASGKLAGLVPGRRLVGVIANAPVNEPLGSETAARVTHQKKTQKT